MGCRGSGELERAIMRVRWDSGESLPVRGVLAALDDDDLAYPTVMTVLDRLARKATGSASHKDHVTASFDFYAMDCLRSLAG